MRSTRSSRSALVDLLRFVQGSRFSLQALYDELVRIDLTPQRRFDVPVVFLLGRHDWTAPSTLAARYFESLEAPCKHLFWFERSAHNPPFDEPERFDRIVDGPVRSLALEGCPRERAARLKP